MPRSGRGVATSGAATPSGLLLFASAQDEPRARRPTDIALAIAGALLLVVTAVICDDRREPRPRARGPAGHVPGLLRPAVAGRVLDPGGVVATLLVAALVRRRPRPGPRPRRQRRRRGADRRGRSAPSSPTTRGACCAGSPPPTDRRASRPARSTISTARHLHRLAAPQPPVPAVRPLAHRAPAARLAVPRRHDGDRRRRRHRHRSGRRGHRPHGRRLARRPPDDGAHPSGAGGPRPRRRRAGAGVDAPRGHVPVRRYRRRRAAGRQGLRPGRLGRPAAGQPLAPGVVPGHAARRSG